MTTTQNATFSDLLASAVTEPGIVAECYRQFHNYSLGNQLLAYGQCKERDLTPGPLATFRKWSELGRHVLGGQKAITLCMPVTGKRKAKNEDEEDVTYRRFTYRPNWFVMTQTEGAEVPVTPVPEWDADMALAALDVSSEPFTMVDGNCMGYARERTIAISPLNTEPMKTVFHEVAHILLGHTADGVEMVDTKRMARKLKEAEAEGVAMLCCAALDLPGAAKSRGYIQNWWGKGNVIPEENCKRILQVADRILKAGRKAA